MRPPPAIADRKSLGVLAGLILAYALLAYGVGWPESWVGHLSDLAWTGFSFAAGWRCLAVARRQGERRQRLAWALLGAAALAWCAGNVYLICRQFLNPDFPPYPTLANYLFLALAPLYTAGLYQLKPRVRGDAPAPTGRLANLLLIGCATSLVSIMALLEPLRNSDRSTELIAFAILDPAAFGLAALFGLSCLWLLGLDTSNRASALLVAAITVHALADLYYFSSLLSGLPNEGSIEWTWLVAFALQYLAAEDHDRGSESAARQRSGALFLAWAEASQALVPSTLLLLVIVALGVFRANLSGSVLWISLPILAAFAMILGLREWSIYGREKRLHGQVALAEARSRRLLTASPAVLFTCRPDAPVRATFVSPNAESALSLPPTDRTLWHDRVHPSDREREREEFSTVLLRGGSSSRFRLLDDRNQYRWVYRKMILTRDEAEMPDEIVGSLIDVTENKQLEAQLFRSQRMESLGHLAGGIAHDFNNMLTTIMGHAELGLYSEQTAAEARAGLEAILEAGNKAAAMTKQLLAFSSRQTLQLEPLDVNRSVHETIAVLMRLIPENIHLRVIDRVPGVVAKSDKGHLEQLVMNLVLNARDAMPDGGRLTVEIDLAILDENPLTGCRADQYAVISVSDTGSGMSEEIQASIFEPFFTTKERGKGTGLGLAIVHGIVRQHGGYVEVESEEGRGSEIRLFLPASDEPLPSRGETGAAGDMLRGSERVLIVEDDEAIARLLRHALLSAGYLVETAGGGAEALDLMRRAATRFDVVLTDVVMPGLSGRQLVEALRREGLDPKVIFMSGYADDSRLLQEIDSGEAPLLRKPLRLSDLTRTIRQSLDSPATSTAKLS
jgi:signal transduction histidine kinase/CheY-like chemotaxis protein